MNHPAVPGLKLADLAESAVESTPLSPVAGKHIGSNGLEDVSTPAVLPSASLRTSDNKVNSCSTRAYMSKACVLNKLQNSNVMLILKYKIKLCVQGQHKPLH